MSKRNHKANKNHAVRRWIVISTLAILVLFVLIFHFVIAPNIASKNAEVTAKADAAKAVAEAAKTLPFTPYYPTYVPSGLPITEPKLRGFVPSSSTNEAITFLVGKIEFQESKQLSNQTLAVNLTNNCDIFAVFSTMLRMSTIDDATLSARKNNIVPCRLVGTTKGGVSVYSEQLSDSQVVYYFAAIGDTIAVAKYDTVPRPRYAADFESEIFKVYDSLQVLDTAKLIAG